jgi:ABC-type branched-subunit amino acid transport system substrate-binding protein
MIEEHPYEANSEGGKHGLSRRSALQAGLATIAAPSILRLLPANAQSRTIKIGFIVPQTGPLASFGEPIPFLSSQIQKATNGRIQSGGKQYEFQILVKDSQEQTSRRGKSQNCYRRAEPCSELTISDAAAFKSAR